MDRRPRGDRPAPAMADSRGAASRAASGQPRSALFNLVMIMMIVGACGVFVAVSGWLGSWLYLRAEPQAIQTPSCQPPPRRRQPSGPHPPPQRAGRHASLGVLILFAGILGQLWWEGGLPGVDVLIFIGFGAALVVATYASLATWFVVTPEHLRIDTMLRREAVPRHLLDSFDPGLTDVRLHLRTGGTVRFRVDSPFEDIARRYRENRGAQISTLNRIVHGLSAVPAAPTEADEVVVTTRWWCVVGAVVAVVAFVIAVLLAGGSALSEVDGAVHTRTRDDPVADADSPTPADVPGHGRVGLAAGTSHLWNTRPGFRPPSALSSSAVVRPRPRQWTVRVVGWALAVLLPTQAGACRPGHRRRPLVRAVAGRLPQRRDRRLRICGAYPHPGLRTVAAPKPPRRHRRQHPRCGRRPSAPHRWTPAVRSCSAGRTPSSSTAFSLGS